jgi:hypothetical protein
MLLLPMAIIPPQIDACVTKREYQAIHNGWTRKKVERRVGAKGYPLWTVRLAGDPVKHQVVTYKACGTWAANYIWVEYRAKRVVYKTAVATRVRA